MIVSNEYLRQRRLRLLQTIFLAVVMIYLAARAASVVLGPVGGLLSLALIGTVTLAGVGSRRILLPNGTRKLAWYDAPEFHDHLRDLSERAGLEAVPPVFILPSERAEAMTTGVGGNTMILLSRGLLATLSMRELRTVVAHEIAHIRNRDLPLFAVVAAMQRVTRLVAGALGIILIVTFPLLFFGTTLLPPAALLYLGVVPVISLLVQFALLRTREFQADLGAVELTGDPAALASALARLDHVHRPLWSVIVMGGTRRSALSELLKTHPSTAERIERLRDLARDVEAARPRRF
ncbi:MAG: M48 family metalloprotease [Spirochaetales bacterium]|nr:M48 family metalloprotease [Spirochaetales bacterium]